MFSPDLRPSVNYTFTVGGFNSLGRSRTVNVSVATPGAYASIDVFKLHELQQLPPAAVVFTAAVIKL